MTDNFMYNQPSAVWNNAHIHPLRLEVTPQPPQSEDPAWLETGDGYPRFYADQKQACSSNPHVHDQFQELDLSWSNIQRICATNFESNDKVTTIPIRAPVPLLYSQRDKAGLEVMESIAQKGSTAHYLQEEEDSYGYLPAFERTLSLEFDYSETVQDENTVFVVRPVTPSTMIALTDPCLMPPLHQTDVEFLHFGGEQAPMSTQPEPRSMFSDSGPKSSKPVNIWGY